MTAQRRITRKEVEEALRALNRATNGSLRAIAMAASQRTWDQGSAASRARTDVERDAWYENAQMWALQLADKAAYAQTLTAAFAAQRRAAIRERRAT